MPEYQSILSVSSRLELFCEKETLAQVFSWEYCEIFKNTFFSKNTSVGCFYNDNDNKCISITTLTSDIVPLHSIITTQVLVLKQHI